MGTYSFYFSHHITTLEGGITVAKTQDDAELMRILRAHGWIREVEDQKPWIKRYPEIHPRFLFVNLGYNLRATELKGDGFRTTPKLPSYVEADGKTPKNLCRSWQMRHCYGHNQRPCRANTPGSAFRSLSASTRPFPSTTS